VTQEDWIRRLVHRRAIEVARALETGEQPPELSEDEVQWMALELVHLMTAGDFEEATR
jgi:hypothetical protein